jgi:hypothetical protein
MPLEKIVTAGSIWIALFCYAGVLAVRLFGTSAINQGENLRRILWTLGCVFLVGHAAGAFHFYHQWSHAEAFAHIARRTQEGVGLAWGGGVYVNYAFVLTWVADAAWWWLHPDSYRRRPFALEIALAFFFVFMIVNGAIVFADGPIRLVTLLVGIVLAAAWVLRRPQLRAKREAG